MKKLPPYKKPRCPKCFTADNITRTQIAPFRYGGHEFERFELHCQCGHTWRKLKSIQCNHHS